MTEARGEATSREVSEALGILRQAMKIEQEGHEFYLKAAHTTQDEKGQETFATLAEDESRHLQLIQKQYESLTHESQWASLTEIKPSSIPIDKPLFPRGKKALEKTVSIQSTETQALLFGIDIENRSYDLYRKGAAKIRHPLGKQVFEFLASEERGHFNILMMRYEYLAGPIGWRY
jgi:rubrerythrin